MTDYDALEGRDEVLDVLDALQAELAGNTDWENRTLERYLDAFNALLGSIELENEINTFQDQIDKLLGGG